VVISRIIIDMLHIDSATSHDVKASCLWLSCTLIYTEIQFQEPRVDLIVQLLDIVVKNTISRAASVATIAIYCLSSLQSILIDLAMYDKVCCYNL
jgi:hypothetical protein